MQNQLQQLVGDLATGWPEFGEIERDTETERDTESERDRGIRERERVMYWPAGRCLER